MNDLTVPLDRNSVEGLLRDPIILRIVTVVNLASLSILELLEYGFNHENINAALSKGVIAIDKSTLLSGLAHAEKMSFDYPDYYLKFLSSKVRLTELGLYILETIKATERLSLVQPRPQSLDEENSTGPKAPPFSFTSPTPQEKWKFPPAHENRAL